MVFYLKYRPKKISELDSKVLADRLETVLKGKLPDKIPHAFLFTGPKGLGKTSTARIVAKAINCTNRKEGEFEPCNKCDSCKAIDSGASLDVLEIDGASNRGIDEIRDLREKIRLSPVNSKKKIYIIDEVHMLTTEAFNALLKTLEEPPEHAVFILCTTEAQKVPETILSRCFNIKFTRATDEDLVHSFNRIAKGEGIKADKEALFQIAKMSDGSFRDGAKILEEITIGLAELTTEIIEEKYNYSSVNKSISDLINALEAKDAKKGVKIISDLSSGDADFKLFTEQLINTLHARLLDEVQNSLDSVSQTRNLIIMLVKSHTSIKYAVLPELPLELAIVEWCSVDDPELNTADSKNENKKEDLKPLDSIQQESVRKVGESKLKISDEESKKPSKQDIESDNILESLIGLVQKENFSVAGVLRGCKVEKFEKSNLVLSTEFKFHKERLSDKKVIEMLEKILKEITTESTKISVELRG